MKSISTIILCFMLPSCAVVTQEQRPGQASDNQVELATRIMGLDWPALPDFISTTDGEIYLDNLNSQVSVIRQNPALTQRVQFTVMLAGLLYQRFQIEGRIADAEQARDLLAGAQLAPRFSPDDHLVYAKVLLGFHDFDAAAEQIALAEKKNAAASAVDAARDALNRALNLPVKGLKPGRNVSGDYIEAVQQAATLLNRGQLEDASVQLRRAQELYRDSSPLPLAWIHVQQGIAFLRYGELEQARVFFAAAHERFPQYFLATEHLAETEGLLGNHQRSAELYREVTAQNDQPGFWHGLAAAETALGNQQAAKDAAERAAAGYDTLLAQYPLMYADHAVGYYLDIGNPERALELARQNFAHRHDLMAHLALAEALISNGSLKQACMLVKDIRNAGLAPPEITLQEEPLARCE